MKSRLALALLVVSLPVLASAQWLSNPPDDNELRTDDQVRLFGDVLPQFTIAATNEARIQLKTGNATKFLINYDGTLNADYATVGTQSSAGELRLMTNGLARTRITTAGNVVTTTLNSGYTLAGETMGARVFSLDTSAGAGFGRAALIAANGGNAPFAIKANPIGREYGLAGIVGAAADSGGGGRHNIGVYGYTLFNIAGTNTNTMNLQTAGLFISELGSSVTDFQSTQYGVYSRADARGATGTNPANQIGIYAEAHGRSGDSATGGLFTAGSGANNRGVQVSNIAAATNNYAIYSDAAAKTYIAGNVGIGTTSPNAKLHVAGDVVADGNIAAKYQDLAEWVPATEDLEPGTVVVLHPTLSNHILASTRAYDTTVAGVVSSQPGIILGESGASKEQIATTGRVKVRVDATAGPIRIGDLLVSSDKSGTAMKSQPLDLGGVAIHRPGTVIGKALEPLESGVGEILVLLSLQ